MVYKRLIIETIGYLMLGIDIQVKQVMDFTKILLRFLPDLHIIGQTFYGFCKQILIISTKTCTTSIRTITDYIVTSEISTYSYLHHAISIAVFLGKM